MSGRVSRSAQALPLAFFGWRALWVGVLSVVCLALLAGCGPSDREIDATVEARIASRETPVQPAQPLQQPAQPLQQRERLTSVALNDTIVEGLRAWYGENYLLPEGHEASNWDVSAGGKYVTQWSNGPPSVFVVDHNLSLGKFEATIEVDSTDDDDLIGFVLGFQPGDSANSDADYLLIDWKQRSQHHDFPRSSSSGDSMSPEGLAVSRVQGVPDLDEFWQHRNLNGTPKDSGLQELQRGNTLGSTGWRHQTQYLFKFELIKDRLNVWVNGSLELSLTPPKSLTDRRFGFYTFSQRGVVFSTADSLGSFKAEAQSPYPSTEESGNRSSSSSGRSAPLAPTPSTYRVGTTNADSDLLTEEERRNNILTVERREEIQRTQEARDRRGAQEEADRERRAQRQATREVEDARHREEVERVAEQLQRDAEQAVEDVSEGISDAIDNIFGNND